MSAQVVYSGVGAEYSVQGNLFRGQRFWLAQKVPTRSRFLNLILVWRHPLSRRTGVLITSRPMVVRSSKWKTKQLSKSLIMNEKMYHQIRVCSSNLTQLIIPEYRLTSNHSYSYSYIEQSIKQGMLANPDDHVAGPSARTIRGVGSTTIRPKGTRTSFTAEDDKILLAWVRNSVRKGASEKGNDLYKQLESHVGSAY